MSKIYEIKGDKNPKIKSLETDDVIKFRRGKVDLREPEVFEDFIKSCENMIRKDPRYKNYISELKSMGFTKDVFQSGIDNERFPNTRIEMHHGPIFNLFEICAIVADHLLETGEKINSFDVAKLVLEEHEKHHIMVVMGLTKTNHELVHDGKMFVHIKQSIGDVLKFLKKYKKGVKREHLYTLERYIRLCQEYEATDNDYLELRKIVKKVDKFLNKIDD